MFAQDDYRPPPPLPQLANPQTELGIIVIPWDGNLGSWPRRWWDTWLMAMFHPGRLFAAVREGGRLDRAILFFVVALLLQAVIAPLTAGYFETSLADRLFKKILPSTSLADFNLAGDMDISTLLPDGRPPGLPPADRVQDQPRPSLPGAELIAAWSPILEFVSHIFSVLLVFLSLFMTAAVFQAGAWLFVSGRRPYGDTLRTVAYAHAPLVWCLVPVVGGVVFVVWLSVLLVMGLRIVHRTSKSRVVAALSFWPTIGLLAVGSCCYLLIRQLTSAAGL